MMKTSARNNANGLLLTIPQVCELTNLGETTVFALIASHELRSMKVGRRRLVARRDLDGWIASRVAGRSTTKRR
jgi:excisionase family DNA binding protein